MNDDQIDALLAATEPVCDGLTPIDTTSTDYKAGEADGYEHGWKARDRELWESRAYSEDEVLSALNCAGIVRGGALMNQVLEQLHGGPRMNPNDVRHVLRKWAHYEGWDVSEDTLRAIADDILALPGAGADAATIFLDLRDQLATLDPDRLRIYRSEFDRIEAKHCGTRA